MNLQPLIVPAVGASITGKAGEAATPVLRVRPKAIGAPPAQDPATHAPLELTRQSVPDGAIPAGVLVPLLTTTSPEVGQVTPLVDVLQLTTFPVAEYEHRSPLVKVPASERFWSGKV